MPGEDTPLRGAEEVKVRLDGYPMPVPLEIGPVPLPPGWVAFRVLLSFPPDLPTHACEALGQRALQMGLESARLAMLETVGEAFSIESIEDAKR